MDNFSFLKIKDRLKNTPKINFGQIDIRVVILFFLLVIVSAFVGFNITKLPPLVPVGIVAAIGIGILTAVNTNFGLSILIFSMLLSPEIPLAQTPERAVVVRIDDFLIMAVFFVWLAKLAFAKELRFLRRTPLNQAIFLYLGANIFSSVLGIIVGDVRPTVALFYILKYTEFFMIYFLFANNIQDLKQVKVFLFCFLLTFFIIGILTYAQAGRAYRPSAPFEGEHPEPNTLGGYLMVCLLVTVGMFLHQPISMSKMVLGGLFCFNIYPLFMTLSRSSYAGLTLAYLSLVALAKKGRMILLTIFTVSIVLFPIVVPKVAIERILYTFSGTEKYQVGQWDVKLDKSASARFQSWADTIEGIKKKPFFGYGITGFGFIDSQYARALAELGILGFFAMLWLMYKILVNTWQIYGRLKDEFSRGLTLGFLSAFIGLIVVAFGANIFVIVRISEPLWFLAACVMVLPEIQDIKLPLQEDST